MTAAVLNNDCIISLRKDATGDLELCSVLQQPAVFEEQNALLSAKSLMNK